MALLETILGLLPSLITAGTSIGQSVYNTAQQEKTNLENRQYASDLTHQQWVRDDSSLQRQVSDAKKAGLSPLAVTGSVASSSPVVAQANSPQMDLSGLLGAMTSATSVLDSSANRQLTREQGEEQTRQFEKNLRYTTDQFNKNLKLQKDIFNADQSYKIQTFNKQMMYNYSQLQQSGWSVDSSNAIQLSNQSLQVYQSVCQSLGVSPKTVYVDNLPDYKTKMNTFMDAYNDAMKKFNGVYASYSESKSTSSDFSDNNSAGGNVGVPGVASVGANASTSHSEGNSESSAISYDQTPNLKALILEALNGTEFPLYRPAVSRPTSYDYSPITQ